MSAPHPHPQPRPHLPTRSPSPLLLTTILLISLSLLIPTTAAAAQCYMPDGSQAAEPIAPCNTTIAVSACCDPRDSCTTSGLCLGASGWIYRSACTDQTWGSPACPSQCQSDPILRSRYSNFAPIYPCAAGVGTPQFCCASYAQVADPSCCATNFTLGNTGLAFKAGTDALQAELASATASASSAATVTVTATSSAATGTQTQTGSSGGGTSVGTAVGVGVGVPLGVLALGILAFLVWRERRRGMGQQVGMAAAAGAGVGAGTGWGGDMGTAMVQQQQPQMGNAYGGVGSQGGMTAMGLGEGAWAKPQPPVPLPAEIRHELRA